MADIPINVDISLGVNQASLKKVARQVEQEIGNVLAEVAIGIDTHKVKKELDKIPSNIQVNVDFITFDSSAIKAAHKYLNETLGTIKISDISLVKTRVANARKQIAEALNNIKISSVSLDTRIKDDIKQKLSTINTLRISHVSLDTRIKDELKQKLSAIDTIRIKHVSLDTRIKDDIKKKLSVIDTLRIKNISLDIKTKDDIKEKLSAIDSLKISSINVSRDAVRLVRKSIQDSLDKNIYINNVLVRRGAIDRIRKSIEDSLKGIEIKIKADVSAVTERVTLPTLNSATAFVAAADATGRSLGSFSARVGEAEKQATSLAGALANLTNKMASGQTQAAVPIAAQAAVTPAAIAAAAAGGAGGLPPIPPMPPAPPSATPPPPSDGDDDESARLDKLEANLAKIVERVRRVMEVLAARTQQAATSAGTVANTLEEKVARGASVLAETLNKTNVNMKRAQAASGSAADIFADLDRYKSVLEATIEGLKKQKASQSLIANLTKRMEQVEALRLAFAEKALKDLQAKQAKEAAQQAKQNVGIEAQIAAEEKKIVKQLEDRRRNLKQNLANVAQASNQARAAALSQAARRQTGDYIRQLDSLSKELEMNKTRESALGTALDVMTRVYGENSREAANIASTFIRVRQKTQDLEHAIEATKNALRTQVGKLAGEPLVPRVLPKLSKRDPNRSEADIALFGETPAFMTDGGGKTIGTALLRQQEILIRTNQQLVVNRLKEVRSSNDYAQSVKDLVNAQNRAAAHQEKLAQLSQTLERSVSRSIVSSQSTLANLADLKPFSGGSASKRFDSNLGLLGPGADVQTQARFLELIQQQGTSLERSARAFKSHNGIIGRTSELVSNLNVSYTVGQKAAYEFGKAAASAAQRFVAWAVPAAFIFKALGLIQESTQQIIRLDTEATRLAFFSPSFFQNTADSIERFDLTVKRVNQSLSDILETSKATGLSIAQTSEAFIEIARAGIQQTSGVAGEAAFRDAVTALVQVEAGALSSADAVVKLNAILNQFNLNPLQDAKLVAAQLFQESQRSAFSVGELADAVARVGSAFAGIQNLRFDQVLGLIGQGATTTGASVSRLATALRQLATLAAQNAEKLANFGVSVTTSEGQLTGFEDVLNVLERINSLSGTVFQRQLASLVADRRNIADIIALARNVELLRKAVKQGASEQEVAADASAAVRQLQLAQAAAAETLTQKLERLRTSLVELVEKTGIREFFSDLLDFTRRLTTNAQVLVPIVGSLATILKSLLIFKGAQLAGSFLRGAVNERLSNRLQLQSISATSDAVKEGRTQDAIFHALDAQLITKKQAAALDKANLENIARRASLESRHANILREIDSTKKLVLDKTLSEAEGARKLNILNEQKQSIERQIEQTKIRQEAIQQRINDGIARGAKQQRGFLNTLNKMKPALLSAAGVGLIFAADFISSSFTKVNEEAAKALKPIDVGRQVGAGVLKGLVSGLVAGAAFGSVPGAIGGAIIGGLSGAIISFSDAKAQNEEISKELDRQRELRDKAQEAANRQIELIRLQATINSRTAKDQDSALSRQLALQTQIQELQVRINSVGEERAAQLGYLNDLQEAQKNLMLVQEQLSIREAERTKERVQLEEDLIKIRERGARIVSVINVLEEARVGALERVRDEVGVAEIKIKFNREQIAREIKTAQEEVNRLSIALSRLEREPGRDQEEKRLAADRQRAEERITSLRLKLISEELRGQKEIFRISEEAVKKNLENYKTVTSQITQSLIDIVQEQNKIANIISRSGDTALESLRLEAERQFAIISSQGLDESALARRLAQAQQQIAQQSFAVIQANAERQLATLRDSPIGSLDNISEEVSRLSGLFAEVNAGLGLFGKIVSDEQRLRAEQANQEIALFKQRLDQEKAAIAVRKQAIQREIQVINSVIVAKQREIEAIEKRISKEAEIGQEFLQTPEKIVGELRSLLLARSALAKVRNDSQEGFINDLEDRIRRAQGQGVPGNALLQKIFEGLQAAEKFNVRLSSTLSPQQLSSTFARLVAFNGGRVSRSFDERSALEKEISDLRTDIIDRLNKQREDDEKEANLNRASAELSRNINNQLIEVQGKVADEISKSTEEREKQRGILEKMEKKIEDFASQNAQLTSGFASLQFTTGDVAIVDAINKTTQALNYLVSASPEARELRARAERERTPEGIIGTFLEEMIGLSGGNIAPFIEEFTRTQLLTNDTLNAVGREFVSALGISAQEISRDAARNRISETDALVRAISQQFTTSSERAQSIGKLNRDLQKTLLEALITETNESRALQERNAEILKSVLSTNRIFADDELFIRRELLGALSEESRERLISQNIGIQNAIGDIIEEVSHEFADLESNILYELATIVLRIPEELKEFNTSLGPVQVKELIQSQRFADARTKLTELESKSAAQQEEMRRVLRATNPELYAVIELFEELRKKAPSFATVLASANSRIIELRDELSKDIIATAQREQSAIRTNLESRRFEASAVSPTERTFYEAISGQNMELYDILSGFIYSMSMVSGAFGGALSVEELTKKLIGGSAQEFTEIINFLKSELDNPEERPLFRELLKSTALLQSSPLFSGGGKALTDLIIQARERRTRPQTSANLDRFDPATRAIINDFFAGRKPVIPPQEEPAEAKRRRESQEALEKSTNEELIKRIEEENAIRRQNLEAVKQSKEAFDKAANQFKSVADKLDKRELTVKAQPVQISPESVESLNASINESITSSISSLAETISRLEAVVTNSQINVEFGDFNVRLFAEIIAKIQDNGFADALRERLAGTAIESQVDAIINAVTDVIRAMESTTPPLLSARTEAIDAVIANSAVANGGKTKPGRKR